MARKLAAKCALATRIDALADDSKGCEVGMECRAGLEAVLRAEQERGPKKIGGATHKHEKYHFKRCDILFLKKCRRPFLSG